MPVVLIARCGEVSPSAPVVRPARCAGTSIRPLSCPPVVRSARQPRPSPVRGQVPCASESRRTLVVLPESYAECGSAERPLRYPSPVRSRVRSRRFARPAAADRPNTTCSRPPCRSDFPGRNSPQRLPARGILCSGRRLTQAVGRRLINACTRSCVQTYSMRCRSSSSTVISP
jgi:hypothetical protein